MTDFDPLNRLHIASPCSQAWDGMNGDDRKRFCGECQLNVFNLSAMSRDEARGLIERAEGRVCVRYYRRADGTVLTTDCPVGRARWRVRLGGALARATASLGVAFMTLIGCARERSVLPPPAIDPITGSGAALPPDVECLQGDVAMPVMGEAVCDPAIEAPGSLEPGTPVEPPQHEIMGRIWVPRPDEKDAR